MPRCLEFVQDGDYLTGVDNGSQYLGRERLYPEVKEHAATMAMLCFNLPNVRCAADWPHRETSRMQLREYGEL